MNKKNRFLLSILCGFFLLLPSISIFAQDSTSLQEYAIPQVVKIGYANYKKEDIVCVIPSSYFTVNLGHDTRNDVYLKTVITKEALTENHNTVLLPEITNQVSGLFSTSRSSMGYGISTGSAGSIKIRGVGGGAQMMVLIDGQPQFVGLMGHPIVDAYSTMMAERVEVIKGPASLFYGSNAMAGVINIVTQDRDIEDIQRINVHVAGGSYGTLEAEASHAIAKDKFTSNVGVQYQRTDGHRDNSDYDQMGGFVNLGYSIFEHWKLTADANVTHFNSSNPGPESAPLIDNDAEVTRGLSSVTLRNRYGKSRGMLRGFYDWGRHTIDNGYVASASPTAVLYNHKDYITGVMGYQDITLVEPSWYASDSKDIESHIIVGFDYQNYGGSAWNENKTTGDKTYLIKLSSGELVERQSIHDLAGYISVRQRIKRYTFNAGLRVDHNSIVGTELVPLCGINVAFPKTISHLKMIVSKGFRNPTIRELYLFAPANSELEAEKMMNYEMSFIHYFKDMKGDVSASVFLIDGDNLITTSYDSGSPLNVNVGDFRNWGFELSSQYSMSKNWSIDGSYSYLAMRKAIEGAPEGMLKLRMNYHQGKWNVNCCIQNISGLYITTGANSEKENYTLLNATINYSLARMLDLYVKGENLLAEKYQTYKGFYMPQTTIMFGVVCDIRK